ncbi:hypothetical protein GCM10009067_27220 [Haloarcula sebkhae]|uniref:Uncharacterized protein n=1 Tax=Haloarcula sebkhae TaxID=932660 RepID=A0A830ETW0_9EURY|nr:hypothetical protein GCM10009067_27220 [Haloarcula sebkhae]
MKTVSGGESKVTAPIGDIDTEYEPFPVGVSVPDPDSVRLAPASPSASLVHPASSPALRTVPPYLTYSLRVGDSLSVVSSAIILG